MKTSHVFGNKRRKKKEALSLFSFLVRKSLSLFHGKKERKGKDEKRYPSDPSEWIGFE